MDVEWADARFAVRCLRQLVVFRQSHHERTVHNNGAPPVSVNQQNSATRAYYHLLMDQPTAPFALLGTATVGKDGKVDVVLSNTVSNQYLMADAVAIRPGPVRIIDDSFAGFSGNNVAHYYGENDDYDVSHVPGYTTPTPGTGYALDSTSSAQWAFTGLADGTYKVYATWASSGTIQSNGQTSVPWSIVGTSLGGNVDQRNGPYRDSLSGDLQSVDGRHLATVGRNGPGQRRQIDRGNGRRRL